VLRDEGREEAVWDERERGQFGIFLPNGNTSNRSSEPESMTSTPLCETFRIGFSERTTFDWTWANRFDRTSFNDGVRNLFSGINQYESLFNGRPEGKDYHLRIVVPLKCK